MIYSRIYVLEGKNGEHHVYIENPPEGAKEYISTEVHSGKVKELKTVDGMLKLKDAVIQEKAEHVERLEKMIGEFLSQPPKTQTELVTEYLLNALRKNTPAEALLERENAELRRQLLEYKCKTKIQY